MTFFIQTNSNYIYFLVYDASSKYPRGMLSSEVNELGDFDQCMSVSSKRHGIYGAYAIAIIQLRSFKSDATEPTYYDLAENDRQRLNVKIYIYIYIPIIYISEIIILQSFNSEMYKNFIRIHKKLCLEKCVGSWS